MRRSTAAIALLLATALGAVLLPGGTLTPASGQAAPYSVLQMNLCLSGKASCFDRATYPAVVDDAVREVEDQRPDAVTVNEGCRRDVAELARRTGMHLRFAPVLVGGQPLRCSDPVGRGVFGIAVLTRSRVGASESRAFADPAGAEERRWLCVTSYRHVSVCTAHLDVRSSPGARRANDRECTELARVLRWYDDRGPTVFGGDVNRLEPCAPAGLWADEDSDAQQAPGIQHVYANVPTGTSQVTTAPYTDHGYFDVGLRLRS